MNIKHHVTLSQIILCLFGRVMYWKVYVNKKEGAESFLHCLDTSMRDLNGNYIAHRGTIVKHIVTWTEKNSTKRLLLFVFSALRSISIKHLCWIWLYKAQHRNHTYFWRITSKFWKHVRTSDWLSGRSRVCSTRTPRSKLFSVQSLTKRIYWWSYSWTRWLV